MFGEKSLVQQRDEELDKAESLLKDYAAHARAFAQAEFDYRVGIRKASVDEQDKGTRATLIADRVRGKDDIARMKFQMTCEEALAKSAFEGELLAKKRADILDRQIEREWAAAKR